MRTGLRPKPETEKSSGVGMKPLSERDENTPVSGLSLKPRNLVGMKPLSERDEN